MHVIAQIESGSTRFGVIPKGCNRPINALRMRIGNLYEFSLTLRAKTVAELSAQGIESEDSVLDACLRYFRAFKCDSNKQYLEGTRKPWK
jgi:hypothetical protein